MSEIFHSDFKGSVDSFHHMTPQRQTLEQLHYINYANYHSDSLFILLELRQTQNSDNY